MTSDFHRAKRVFLAARALPLAERAAYLDAHCDGDSALHREVEELLAAERESQALDAPLLGEEFSLPTAEEMAAVSTSGLRRIGSYRVLRLLGEGGMGTVYLAEQREPRRRVAVKLIRPGQASAGLLASLKREIHFLARLQHPSIAQIHDAGRAETPLGRLSYFVMEYVEGVPLHRHAREQGLSGARRLELLADLCDAVQHAHERGVLHADLKPANVLVTTSGQLKVIDFGVARALVRGRGAPAACSSPAGTLPYMSPEQRCGSADLDARADVYSLGVLALDLLRDEPDAANAATANPPDLLALAAELPHHRTLRGHPFAADVAAIVARVLSPRRSDRYPTAAALRADLLDHLRHRPVAARGGGITYRWRKRVRRHRPVAAALATTVLVTGSVLLYAAWQESRASLASRQQGDLERRLELEARRLERVRAYFLQSLAAHDAREDAPLRDLLGQVSAGAADLFSGDREMRVLLHSSLATTYAELGDAARALGEVEAARALMAPGTAGFDPGREMLLRTRAAAFLLQLGRLEEAEALLVGVIDSGELHCEQHGHALEPERLLASVFLQRGDLVGAEETFRDLLVAAEAPGAASTAALVFPLLRDLGQVRKERRDLDGAERLLRAAWECCREHLGRDHPETLNVQGLLGELLVERGHEGQGLALLRSAEQGLRLRLGEGHPRTLTARHNLAVTLGASGEREQAIELLQGVAACRRELLGEAHPVTILTLCNLGSLQLDAGLLVDAQATLVEAEELARKFLPPDHDYALLARCNRGASESALGHGQEAIEWFQPALDSLRRSLGPDAPRCLALQCQLGGARTQGGDLAAAAALLQDAVRRSEATLGERDPLTLRCMHNLGEALRAADRFEEAAGWLERAATLRQEVLGEGAFGVTLSRSQLATCWVDMGRLQEAEEVLVDCVRRLDALPRPDRRGPTIRSQLGRCLLLQGKLEPALEQCQAAVVQARQLLGADSAATCTAANQLALVHLERGENDAARRLLEECLAFRRRTLGEEHPDTVILLHNLARALFASDREEGIALAERVLSLRRARFGPAHPATLRSQSNLAFFRLGNGEAEAARQLFDAALDELGAGGEALLRGLLIRGRGECLLQLEQRPDARTNLEEACRLLAPVLPPDHPLRRRAELLLRRAEELR